MAALPELPLVSIEEYLTTSYPDGDREYLDGMVLERNVGTPGQSALQHLLEMHLGAHERRLRLAVRPDCRTQITESRYRVPDIVVMLRPFRQTDRVLVDPPFLIIEILSPDDRVKSVMQRFRDYEAFGVPYVVQMDPEERTTFVFEKGSLIRRDLTGFEIPDRGLLPFDSRELLAQLDEELP